MKKVPSIITGTGDQLKSRTKSGLQSYQQVADLGEVPQASNPIYQGLFDNNPYRNLHYNKSSWQNFLSKLGFRTDADRWEEQVQENAAQWDAGIYQQMYADRYNSEASKAERMRAAGENPDFLGTGNVSEAASPMTDPEGMSPGTSEEGVLGQIGAGIIGAFNSAVGIATQFAQLSALGSSVEGSNIKNASEMMSLIGQRVLGMTPAEGFQTDREFQDWKRSTELKLRTQYGQSFFRGASRRRWNRSIDDFVGNLPTSREQYKQWRERLGDAKEYLQGRRTFWDEAVEVFDEINQWAVDLRKDIAQNSLAAEKVQSEVDVQTANNELQYQEDLEPGEKARAQNAEWKRTAEGKTFQGILNEHLNKLGQRLDEFSKQGGLKGLIGEIVLFLMTVKGGFTVDKNGHISGSVQGPQVQ